MAEAAGYTTMFALTFLITALVAAAAWALLEPSRWRKQDVSGEEEGAPSILRAEVLSTISLFAPLLEKIRLVAKLKAMLDEADLGWSVGRTVLAMLLIGVATASLLMRLDWVPAIAAAGCGAAAAFVPIAYIRARCGARLRRVEEQLPEALDFLSRALLAGHSLPMSLELLADEIEAPLALELRKTVDEYNLGLSMPDSLRNLAARLPSVDIQFFVSAVQTQSRTGGSLHELLEKLAETIRERSALKGQIRALTASGRTTAMILTLLPFFVGSAMMMVNPDYFMILVNHPHGTTMLGAALCGQVLAYLVIRKIVDIRI